MHAWTRNGRPCDNRTWSQSSYSLQLRYHWIEHWSGSLLTPNPSAVSQLVCQGWAFSVFHASVYCYLWILRKSEIDTRSDKDSPHIKLSTTPTHGYREQTVHAGYQCLLISTWISEKFSQFSAPNWQAFRVWHDLIAKLWGLFNQ